MTAEKILELFPAMKDIQDEELRRLSIRAMIDAMAQGGWDENNVHLAPVTVTYDGVTCNLIEHVNLVTDICMTIYEKVSGYYAANGRPLDRDTVLCGALLHDIGKFTEYALVDGKICHGQYADIMRHPLSGAVIAGRAGLPERIIHLIATHSFEGDKSYLTAEADFVRTIDQFAFKCSVYGLPKK
ncbi:MAG: HD domain-containing protein [Firmicutes bacterium]|nr:HD domain-containing protein [Bacillota bacterium]